MDKTMLAKAASYCAYQERTQQEVRERLKKWHIFGDEAEEIISELIAQNYINEERFAKSFAGGKFRIKNWGGLKIKQELKRKGLTDYNIRSAMEGIDQDDYEKELHQLIQKKYDAVSRTDPDPWKQKQKVARYAISKGFEPELVWKAIEAILPS
jgi:regulatory protein